MRANSGCRARHAMHMRVLRAKSHGSGRDCRRRVASLREQLRPCGLRFMHAEGVISTVKVLYCKKSPKQVHTLVLEPLLDVPASSSPDLSTEDEVWLTSFNHIYSIGAEPRFLTDKQLPQVDIDMVQVIPDMVCRPGGLVCSDAEILPLSEIIRCREHEAKAQGDEESRRQKRPRKAAKKGAAKARSPAMQRLLSSASSSVAPPSTEAGEGNDDGDMPDELQDEDDDEAVEQWFKRLDHKR